jgi:hypothetical protein
MPKSTRQRASSPPVPTVVDGQVRCETRATAADGTLGRRHEPARDQMLRSTRGNSRQTLPVDGSGGTAVLLTQRFGLWRLSV